MRQERQLINQVLAGDKRAINHFYRQFQPSLFSFIRKRCQNDQDADDITQETLVAGLNSLPNFHYQSSLFSWLCAIAKHETADFYRKKKLKTIIFSHWPFLQDWADTALGPQGKYLKKELKQEIKAVLSSLSEGYSRILRLRYIEGLTVKRIAQKLKISYKAAESRLSRARNKFKIKWQENH